MDKAARAAWAAGLLAKYASTFRLRGLKPYDSISIREPRGEVEIYGRLGTSSFSVSVEDSAKTPSALLVLMEAARGIPCAGFPSKDFLGIGVWLNGDLYISFYGCAGREPPYPEDLEKRVLGA